VTALRAAFGAVLVLLLSGCGGASTPSAPTVTAADAAFVRHMLPHHQRAIAVGALAAQQGSDPRVRAFGQRIVAEQTPEEQRLAESVATLHLSQQPSDAIAADGYIDDAALTRLQTEVGTVFDRDVILLSARSEIGAASMGPDRAGRRHVSPGAHFGAGHQRSTPERDPRATGPRRRPSLLSGQPA